MTDRATEQDDEGYEHGTVTHGTEEDGGGRGKRGGKGRGLTKRSGGGGRGRATTGFRALNEKRVAVVRCSTAKKSQVIDESLVFVKRGRI